MELISTEDHFILHQLVQSEAALWINRHTGQWSVRASWDIAEEQNPECLGAVCGLLGKLSLHEQLCEQLVVIRDSEQVLQLPVGVTSTSHPVYRIKRVALLPISPAASALETPLKACPKHHVGVVDPLTGEHISQEQSQSSKFPFKNLSGKFRQAGETFTSVAGGISNQVKVPWKKEKDKENSRELEKLEKKLTEEFLKLFNDTHSFYFSYEADLTNSLQRQLGQDEVTRRLPLWRRLDQRFFFNRALLAEVIQLEDSRLDPWILPVIQGFIESRECSIESELLSELVGESRLPGRYTLVLLSRRAAARAGTRYKRRGVDDAGAVANYVETEQIVLYHTYALSFTQTRGSIPVFWSQPGIKYRPPPRIDRGQAENQAAFTRHFQQQHAVYGQVNCLSLVERTGREKILADTFLENILTMNDPDVSFISFDFHEHCRGMRFENVSILIENLQELLGRMGYFWLDSHGKVCTQQGVFRVNCVDCLDRTNVVQTAVARAVLETQLGKLGLVQPEQGLTTDTKLNFQSLWANNGDIISRQYAGTNALKGDYTRTGERNISGLVRDGVNSASRYYLNHIRDTYRQAAIDILTGNEISEELLRAEKGFLEEVDHAGSAEHVKTVIEDCKKQITQDDDIIIGAWGLIDSDPGTGDPSQDDMDVVFILTRNCYYFARYDDELDKITAYEKVFLSEIDKIEFGVPEQSFSFLSKTETHCFRILHRIGGEEGFHHMFRSTNLRFFNNVATPVLSEDERVDSLKTIADTVAVTMETAGIVPDMWFGPLDKRRSKTSTSTTLLNPVDMLNIGRPPRSPIKLRTVGSKAISNVTSHFSKLNPISRLRRGNPRDFSDIQMENNEPTCHSNPVSSTSLHLSSSGLLMNTNPNTFSDSDNLEGQVNLCTRTSSIIYSKTNSQSIPPECEQSHTGRPAPHRIRKLSRSSEEIRPGSRPGSRQRSRPSSPDTAVSPLGRITRGIQSFSSNFRESAPSSVTSRKPDEEGQLQGDPSTETGEPRSACQSLVLTI